MAAGFLESAVEEIKARIDLADLIASYGIQVRQAGSTAKACCPFHHEKTPSFNINTAKGFYHCFGCGESGDAIKFVQKQEGLTFVEALRKLGEQCGVKVEAKEDPHAGRRKRLYALMAELAAFYHRCLLQSKEAAGAREYLASRALDGQTAEDWCIGYAPNGIANILRWAEKYKFTEEELEAAGVTKLPTRPGDRGYHRFGGRLMFSVRDKAGRVVAFSGRQLVEKKNSGKYVNSPETVIFKKSNVLFGFDRAAGCIARSPHREAIVCEGQIDTIRLHASGFPVAVASQGTAFTAEHVRMLKKVADSVLLVFDDDSAGHKATVRTAGLFLAEQMPVRVVNLPEGDDPDSFLRSKGADRFRELLDAAESIVSFQCRVERAKESNPDSIDAVHRVCRAVLNTIAMCPSAVLRASMANEAARLLSLPAAALSEELENFKIAPAPAAPVVEDPPEEAPSAPEDMPEDPVKGEDAASSLPPPPRETALMAFLMNNGKDAVLDGMVGEFLPDQVFVHEFTRRYVEVWRRECAGEEAFSAFAAALSPNELKWLDTVVFESGKTLASSLSAVDILQDFVRALWEDRLKRRRGALAMAGDDGADAERLRISMDLKRLRQVKWHTVKIMIRDLMKGENSNGH